jgi:hypothetical protein
VLEGILTLSALKAFGSVKMRSLIANCRFFGCYLNLLTKCEKLHPLRGLCRLWIWNSQRYRVKDAYMVVIGPLSVLRIHSALFRNMLVWIPLFGASTNHSIWLTVTWNDNTRIQTGKQFYPHQSPLSLGCDADDVGINVLLCVHEINSSKSFIMYFIWTRD